MLSTNSEIVTDCTTIFLENGDLISALPGIMPAEKHNFLVSIPLPFRLPTPVYGAMLAIWHYRPVLKRRFPLYKGNPKDFVRFLAWCAGDGRRQFAILRSMPEWDEALSQRIELPEIADDFWAGGFSVDMFLYGVARYRYTLGPMLHQGAARHRIARAYWRGERHKRFQPTPAQWQCLFLARRFNCLKSLIDVLRLKKNDFGKDDILLAQEFGLSDIHHIFEGLDKSAAFVQKVLPPGDDSVQLSADIGGFPFRLPLKVIRSASWIIERFIGLPTEYQISTITARIPVGRQLLSGSPYPFGVNLFGYAKGEIGIGEDVRMVALALEAQNIPFCIINVQPGSNVSQQDSSVEKWIVSEPRYAINIFCTTGIEQSRYACEQGLAVFNGRYNIGFWPWELPSWPSSCTYTYAMVDEIWGISRYTANAYGNARRPVYAMSLPVTVDCVSQENRADFGLPENDYLFIFSFDFNSKLTRKNPVGVICAFQRAFPLAGNDAVGLVIKASHVTNSNKAWERIRTMIKADPRIHVIDVTLRRPQVLALYRCCDCYVSLHRAEGFGRGLAEALLLEKQLIATSFSGNMDFCTAERVGLVRYKKRDLAADEYFHGGGQYWADPDIDHAAELMQDTYTNPKRVQPNEFDFSPMTIGARYARRLREIKRQLNLTREI